MVFILEDNTSENHHPSFCNDGWSPTSRKWGAQLSHSTVQSWGCLAVSLQVILSVALSLSLYILTTFDVERGGSFQDREYTIYAYFLKHNMDTTWA